MLFKQRLYALVVLSIVLSANSAPLPQPAGQLVARQGLLGGLFGGLAKGVSKLFGGGAAKAEGAAAKNAGGAAAKDAKAATAPAPAPVTPPVQAAGAQPAQPAQPAVQPAVQQTAPGNPSEAAPAAAAAVPQQFAPPPGAPPGFNGPPVGGTVPAPAGQAAAQPPGSGFGKGTLAAVGAGAGTLGFLGGEASSSDPSVPARRSLRQDLTALQHRRSGPGKAAVLGLLSLRDLD